MMITTTSRKATTPFREEIACSCRRAPCGTTSSGGTFIGYSPTGESITFRQNRETALGPNNRALRLPLLALFLVAFGARVRKGNTSGYPKGAVEGARRGLRERPAVAVSLFFFS